MELFKLLGRIAVDNSEANASIDESIGKASSFSETLASGISTVANWGVSVVKGTYTAMSGLASFARSSAQAADTIDKMSQKIGISREAYQQLDFICSQSGTSVSILQGGLRTLTAAMDGAASGTESNIEQFERLGVAVVDASGNLRSQEEVMWDTLEALQNVENQTEKARLATELFGRSGTELMPLLNGASGSIDAMKQQAHDLGLILSDELVDSGVALTDSLDQTKRAFQSIVIQLGGVLMPVVEKASAFLQSNLPEIRSFMEQMEPVVSSLFDALLPPIVQLTESILPILTDVVGKLMPMIVDIIVPIIPILADVLEAVLTPLIQIVQIVLPPILDLLTPILELLSPLLEVAKPICDILIRMLPPLMQLITKILNPIIELLVDLISEALIPMQPLLEWLVDIIGTGIVSAIEVCMDIIEGLKLMFIDTFEAIVEEWSDGESFFSDLWDAIKQIFANVKSWFANKFKDAWNSIKTAFAPWSDFWNGLSNTVGNKLDDIKSKFTTKFDNIKSVVKNAIDKIKELFNFKAELPSIKLPHFKISPTGWQMGDLMKGTIPKLGVDWYAKGGIVDEATAIGINGNNLRVAGEAGKEAIIPLEKNTRGIELIAEKLGDKINGPVSYDDSDIIKRLDELIKKIDELTKFGIVLDTGALVGQLTPAFDTSFGALDDLRKRGG